MFQERLTARYDAQVAAGVANPVAYEVFDPDRMYLVGFSGGAAMCYRIAFEAPLVDADGYEYRFARMFVSAGTVGGFRRGRDQADGLTRVDYSRGTDPQNPPATVTRRFDGVNTTYADIEIMHVQGDGDPRIPAQFRAFNAWAVPGDAYREDGTGQPGTSAVVVVSEGKIADNFVPRGYLVPAALEFARWDYTVEYGLERWIVYKGLDVWASSPIIAPGAATSYTYGELITTGAAIWAPATAAEIADYGLGDRVLLQYGAGGREVVFMLVRNMKPWWSTAPFDIRRMALDFLAGSYP